METVKVAFAPYAKLFQHIPEFVEEKDCTFCPPREKNLSCEVCGGDRVLRLYRIKVVGPLVVKSLHLVKSAGWQDEKYHFFGTADGSLVDRRDLFADRFKADRAAVTANRKLESDMAKAELGFHWRLRPTV